MPAETKLKKVYQRQSRRLLINSPQTVICWTSVVRQEDCALHLHGRDTTSQVLMLQRNRFNKHSKLLKKKGLT